MSTPALEAAVDIRRTRLELLLKVLDVDGAVAKVSGGWVSTGVPWEYDTERYARVAAARDREQGLMLDYERGDGCRMEFLQRALDDETAAPCGRCDRCADPWFDLDPPAGRRQHGPRAAGPGRRRDRAARPVADGDVAAGRARCPAGSAPTRRCGPGRAVARLTDLGWGQRLRGVLAADAPASEDLLRACVEVLRDWGWDERPVGRRRDAVAGAARAGRVGGAGDRLDRAGCRSSARSTSWTAARPESPAATARSGWPACGTASPSAPALAAALREADGPVLLVDDLVDSRWTLTVAAGILRQAGADAVLPFALATQS